jgi:hypothetical protein
MAVQAARRRLQGQSAASCRRARPTPTSSSATSRPTATRSWRSRPARRRRRDRVALKFATRAAPTSASAIRRTSRCSRWRCRPPARPRRGASTPRWRRCRCGGSKPLFGAEPVDATVDAAAAARTGVRLRGDRRRPDRGAAALHPGAGLLPLPRPHELPPVDGADVGIALAPQWPPAQSHRDEHFGDVAVYFDQVEVPLPLRRSHAGAAAASTSRRPSRAARPTASAIRR